ncbi:MAG: Zn-ribbon domain-containing OB-fold protein [Nocardiopsaceae bacterium]|nr:Zn-ribbon domain-containing OB-fold protein [Nocardiopsaceae bacterium]
MSTEIPLPDDVTAPYWAGTEEKRLLIQRCAECGRFQHYPRYMCTGCGRGDLEFVEASGEAAIDTFTVVHRPLPGFEAPYVVARVRLAEGPILLTNIVDCPPDDVACGQAVRLTWRPLEDGRHLPLFTPAKEG